MTTPNGTPKTVRALAQELLETCGGATSGPGIPQPRSEVAEPCPIINIASREDPPPPTGKRALPSLELQTNRPGQLSLRLSPESQSWSPVFRAMNAIGFEPGDVVRLTLVRR